MEYQESSTTMFIVVCGNKSCGNFEIPIHIEAPLKDPKFICGPCGDSITLVTVLSK